MANITCAYDSNDDILEIGYLTLAYLVAKYPSDNVVTLIDCVIPNSEEIHKYYVDEHEPGKFCIKDKSQADIDTAEAAIQAALDIAVGQTEIDALLALDASQETGTTKILLEHLQKANS